MSQDYKETLYASLFSVLGELTEYESPELIFDRIVEDFAMSAEYHMGQADTFKCMLDTFRHDNPVNTVPDTVSPEVEETVKASMYDTLDFSDINWQKILSNVDPRKRHLMSADSDEFQTFLDNLHFPG